MIPTFDASLTATPGGWLRFVRCVQNNFPGRHNAGLRRRIYRTVASGGNILLLARSVALTASGLASLRACDDALAAWDGRMARRDHDAHRILS